MKTIKIDSGNCKIIAHRGLSVLERENTLAAFIAAGNRGYYGSECDIHLTKDNEFVVHHDGTTGRVAGIDKVIRDATLEELRELSIFDIDLSSTRSDLRIPTLSEYLEISKKYNMKCFIEVKPEFNLPQVKNLLDLIEKHNYLDNTCIISFNYQNLKYVRQLNSSIKLQYLIGKYPPDILKLCQDINAGLDINLQTLSQELLNSFHKAGLEVNVWTVDSLDVASQFIEMGVDYITSNALETI